MMEFSNFIFDVAQLLLIAAAVVQLRDINIELSRIRRHIEP